MPSCHNWVRAIRRAERSDPTWGPLLLYLPAENIQHRALSMYPPTDFSTRHTGGPLFLYPLAEKAIVALPFGRNLPKAYQNLQKLTPGHPLLPKKPTKTNPNLPKLTKNVPKTYQNQTLATPSLPKPAKTLKLAFQSSLPTFPSTIFQPSPPNFPSNLPFQTSL